MIIWLDPLLVIHATTTDTKDTPNQVIISKADDFLAQGKIFATKRLRADKEIREKIAQDSLIFIARDFVLDSSSKRFYCTIFLQEAILKHYKLSTLKSQYLNLPALSGEYLFPQAFWESEDFLPIIEPFRLD